MTLLWFIFPHLLHILPYAGHCFCRCYIPWYLQFYIPFFSFTLCLCYFHYGLFSAYLFLSYQSLVHLFMFSNTAFCDLCDSTLCIQTKTYSLLISLVSFSTLNCLIILAVMASSLMLWMNCSFSLLSFSMYLEFAAFTHNLPTHSCMTFISKFVNVCMNCIPSLPSHFCMVGGLSSCHLAYMLQFVIYLSLPFKNAIPVYFSGAFQLNIGCFRACLPCQRLCLSYISHIGACCGPVVWLLQCHDHCCGCLGDCCLHWV